MAVSSEPREQPPIGQGAPRVRQAAPDPYLDAPPPPVDNSRALYTLAAAVGVAALLIVVGLIVSSVGGSRPAPTPMTTTLSEQRKMMRKAVQEEKNASEMPRERNESVSKEMERGKRISGAGEEKRAEGDFVGD